MPKILHRRPQSGFVKYPKDFEKRMVDGTARFRTKCDMLVGPCACGFVHQESDSHVQVRLDDYDAEIEPINLTVAEDGKVYIPRYWFRPRGHEQCTVLSGECACGVTHTANEEWVQRLLRDHIAKILGCPEVDEPIISSRPRRIDIQEEPLPPYTGSCQCNECRRAWEYECRREREQRRQAPRRNEI